MREHFKQRKAGPKEGGRGGSEERQGAWTLLEQVSHEGSGRSRGPTGERLWPTEGCGATWGSEPRNGIFLFPRVSQNLLCDLKSSWPRRL